MQTNAAHVCIFPKLDRKCVCQSGPEVGKKYSLQNFWFTSYWRRKISFDIKLKKFWPNLLSFDGYSVCLEKFAWLWSAAWLAVKETKEIFRPFKTIETNSAYISCTVWIKKLSSQLFMNSQERSYKEITTATSKLLSADRALETIISTCQMDRGTGSLFLRRFRSGRSLFA